MFKRKILLRSWMVGCVLAGVLAGCIEPYDANLNFNTNLVTVDGTLTDLPEPQVVRLRRSRSSNNNSISEPIRGASLEVFVNGQTRLTLTERAPGDYHLPDGFQTVPGATYQLRFQLSDGTRYESTVETVPVSKPIVRVYDEFDPAAIEVRNTGSAPLTRPGNRIFIDTQDPTATRDFYSWTWTLWENQSVCASCQQGKYYTGAGCVKDRFLNAENFFDYGCEQQCWAFVRSRLINAMADSYSNGRVIAGREVARIPLYTTNGALLEVRQLALTSGAFRYLRLLADQSQNTGSLADTPPASIFGNVSNTTNASERIVGYFTAASVSRTRYWMSRRNVPGTASPVGLLGGRAINPEPSSGPPLRPPLAPCTPDDLRTPVKPEGWQG